MIIMMGVAGAGKSVQAQLLSKQKGIKRISIGDLLRTHLSGADRDAMLKGELINDEIIKNVLIKAIEDLTAEEESILDGFPRTRAQADWLLELHSKQQIKLNAVVHIVAAKETVRERLIKRGRPDDYEDAITKRFFEYDKEILPIIERFENADIKVVRVDGEQSIDEVHNAIVEGLK